jgi:hypothetical protein
VDTYSLIVAGGLGVLVVVFLLIGFLYPGSGADVLDWKPTRSPQLEAENEVDDVAQMIAAQNEMRRRRGAPERSEAEVEADVARDQAISRDGPPSTRRPVARPGGRWTSATSSVGLASGTDPHRRLRRSRPGARPRARGGRPRGARDHA